MYVSWDHRSRAERLGLTNLPPPVHCQIGVNRISAVCTLGHGCSPDFFVPIVVSNGVHLVFGEMQGLLYAHRTPYK